MKQISALLLLILVVAACSRSPYHATNKVHKQQAKAFAKQLLQFPPIDSTPMAPEWVGTTNFSMRKPSYVIIHHTAQNSCDETLRTFTLKRTAVSAHYVICRDGTVHHMLNDFFRAHHAGVSKWGNAADINSNSIGIELDNNGFEYFDERQITSLLALLDRLKRAYSIPTTNFIGHGDIAPTRKNDPNWRFPWKQLADKGFGLWYDTPVMTDTLPAGFNHITALRIIGYDMKDTVAARQAFKRHFLQDSTRGPLSDSAKLILHQLSKKYF